MPLDRRVKDVCPVRSPVRCGQCQTTKPPRDKRQRASSWLEEKVCCPLSYSRTFPEKWTTYRLLNYPKSPGEKLGDLRDAFAYTPLEMPELTEWTFAADAAKWITMWLHGRKSMPFTEAKVEQKSKGSLKRRDLSLA